MSMKTCPDCQTTAEGLVLVAVMGDGTPANLSNLLAGIYNRLVCTACVEHLAAHDQDGGT